MTKNYLQTLEKNIWEVTNIFKGYLDILASKDYILTFLFFKYIDDMYNYNNKYGDENIIHIPYNSSYEYVYKNRNEDNIGKIINESLKNIEAQNQEQLNGIFKDINYDSELIHGPIKEKNKNLKILIEKFYEIKLDPDHIDEISLGQLYELLIDKYYADSSKTGADLHTPHDISKLISELLEVKSTDSIYDPTVGTGSLLITTAMKLKKKYMDSGDPTKQSFSLYAQEINRNAYISCKMNIFIHGIHNHLKSLQWGDTLIEPKILKNNQLMKFNVIVSHPPFSTKNSSYINKKDPFDRFKRGIPPESKSDYAFISHIVSSMNEENGTAAIIMPLGVLFRGGAEREIRKSLIEENLIDAIIVLPNNMLYNTSIPIVIIIFKKQRNKNGILFIDASQEFIKNDQKKINRKNKIDNHAITKIVNIYKKYINEEQFSYFANKQEIRNNDYNLNITRYVKTLEKEEELKIQDINEQITKIQTNLFNTQTKITKDLYEIYELMRSEKKS